jgi:hypothetical protein
MHMMKGILGALLGSTLLVGAAQAAPVTLAYLIANSATITDGDKLFSDFAYGGTGTAPSAANIDVQPFTNGVGDYGLEFSGSFTAIGDENGDAAIGYRVTVTNPKWKITDASAVSTGVAVNGGFWDVGETLTNGVVTVGSLFTTAASPSDSVTFAGVSSLDVVKDIGFHGNGGVADLSVVDQNFSQSAVPEPATWAMMLLGFGGLAVAGYRTSRKPISIAG